MTGVQARTQFIDDLQQLKAVSPVAREVPGVQIEPFVQLIKQNLTSVVLDLRCRLPGGGLEERRRSFRYARHILRADLKVLSDLKAKYERPDQAEDDARVSVDDVGGVDVHKFDLVRRNGRLEFFLQFIQPVCSPETGAKF